MPRFALELMEAAQGVENLESFVCVSEQNEIRASFDSFRPRLISVETFKSGPGFVVNAWRIFHIRHQLKEFIATHKITLVVELMPHVWSRFIGPVFRQVGARWVSILHDANPHPGDVTALAKPLLDCGTRRADSVVVLSNSVGEQATKVGLATPARIITLFHPDLNYGLQGLNFGEPSISGDQHKALPRLLFFGRIMPYKGLELLVSAMELLHLRGVYLPLGVFGEGDLEAYRARLQKLGAEIQNRWLDDTEINGILARHDIMVVSHVEASQSGVISTAFGAGLPVVATPAGGLPEQVEHEVTGLVASGMKAEALADTIERLATDNAMLVRLRNNVLARKGERSMQRFVKELVCMARRDRMRR